MPRKLVAFGIISPAVALLVAGGNAMFVPPPASAADYPAQPIHIIVGFAAGGAPDTLARIVGDKLSLDWGQPVVIENRSGAEGNIAMVVVARAPADGYTLALTPVGNAAVNPWLIANLPYDHWPRHAHTSPQRLPARTAISFDGCCPNSLAAFAMASRSAASTSPNRVFAATL